MKKFSVFSFQFSGLVLALCLSCGAADVASFAPATNPVGTVGTGNTTITIATTVPSGTVTAPVAAAAPSTWDNVLAFLATPAVGIGVAGLVVALFLTVNSKTTQATITHRQTVVDEVNQWEGMVVHAANVVKSNPTLDKLPYVDRTANFIGAFDQIYRNIMGRLPTASEQHDAVATAAQIKALTATVSPTV